MAAIKSPTRTFVTIPEPYGTLDSLLVTAKALKQAVEQLTGGVSAPRRVFIQRNPPNAYMQWDLWIRPPLLPGEIFVWSYWDGIQWRIAPAAAPGADSFATFRPTGSNVALNNTANFFDIVSTPSFGATGQKWLIEGFITAYDSAGAAIIDVALYDGANYVAANAVNPISTAEVVQVRCSNIITLDEPIVLTLRARDQTSVNGTVFADYSGALSGSASGVICTRLS